jgi:uncharacterized membrane protein HdeD (DUF308 family)
MQVYPMALFDILNENHLATASIVLGILAIIFFFLLNGTESAFLYLGIPAIVVGVISIMRMSKLRDHRHIASILLSVTGIILGMTPIIITVLGIN